MRIVDKNYDYYDYLQDPTDIIVFDRRGSWELTREDMLYAIRYSVGYENYHLALLQCGATFWLFHIEYKQDDYDLNFVTSWKNYNKPNALLEFNLIHPTELSFWLARKTNAMELGNVLKRAEDLKASIDHGEYRIYKRLNETYKYKDYKNTLKKTKHVIPILKSCGVAAFVDPQEMFCAIEEYFSIEKTKAETTEPKGATNDDKIIMHGFDTKTSFRRIK